MKGKWVDPNIKDLCEVAFALSIVPQRHLLSDIGESHSCSFVCFAIVLALLGISPFLNLTVLF